MSIPDLKVGDHIRVTDVIEGKVTKIESSGVWMERAEGAGPHVWIDTNTPGWHRTFETVTPPEPEWTSGDVVKAGGLVLGYARGLWRNLTSDTIEHRNLISNYWNAGRLEILYKADAA